MGTTPVAPVRTEVRHAGAPSATQTAATLGHRSTRDPLVIFQIYMVLLVFSPSIYVVPGMGAAGTPATIFGCFMLILWLVGRMTGLREHIGRTPLHWIAAIFCLAMLLSFCSGMLRPISTPEVSSSLRGLITLASGMGVLCLAADSMRTRGRLEAFLRFAVFAGFALASMGVIQSATGINFVEAFHLPWLQQTSESIGLYQRSGYPRVNATAAHSIEFSAVVGMVLPVAAHFALNATTRRWWYWTQFTVLLIALPLTISRSGAVALVIGLLFSFAIATNPQRLVMLIAAPFAAVVFRLLAPGILGTIRNLFAGAAQDDSISGRVSDYQAVATFVSNSPWIGRGFGTFIPSLYRTLDNQFLATAVEAGLIGVLALALLFFGGIATSITAALRARTHFLRSQGLSIAAGITTAMILALTFDEFGFQMAFGMLCLILGAAGGMWRISGVPTVPRAPMIHSIKAPLSTAKRFIVAAVALATLGGGLFSIEFAHGESEAKAPVILRVLNVGGPNLYDEKIDAPGMSDLVRYVMDSPELKDKLAGVSVDDYSVALGKGSLAPFTDVLGSGDLMWIAARASSVDDARSDVEQVRSEMASQVARLQSDSGIPEHFKIRVDTFADIEVFELPVYRITAAGGVIAVACFSALLVAMSLESASRRRRGAFQDTTHPPRP